MSLDPNQLYKSSGLGKVQEKGKQMASNQLKKQAKKRAKKAIAKRFKKAAFKKTAKAFIKKAATQFVKIAIKILVKKLSIILAGVLGFKFWAIAFACLVLLIVVASFVSFDFNFSGTEAGDIEAQEMESIFNSVSMSTIDSSKEEQHEWRVPPGLISGSVMMSQLLEDDTYDEDQNEEFYIEEANKITNGLEPEFDYSSYDLKRESYTVTVRNVCEELEFDFPFESEYPELHPLGQGIISPNHPWFEGDVPFDWYDYLDQYRTIIEERECVEEEEISDSEIEVLETVDKITLVDTWRGHYSLEYEKSLGDYYQIESTTEGNTTITMYQRNEEIEEIGREYNRNFNKLVQKYAELGLSATDALLAEEMFNSMVGASSPTYTSKEELDLSEYVSQPGGGATGLMPGEPVDSSLIPDEGFMWPTPDATIITSGFGMRVHPVTGKRSGHAGMDMARAGDAAGGVNIYALADGVVTLAGLVNGYGQAVYIDHNDGFLTRYGHLQWDAYGVEVGDVVEQGDYIGQIGYGKVGTSTGAHLHLEVLYNGTPQNPIYYVRPPD